MWGPFSLLDRADRVSRQVRRLRLDTCRGCDHNHANVCGKCGCWLPAKTKVASQSCPLGYWTQVPTDADPTG